jgi:hypothetical protein
VRHTNSTQGNAIQLTYWRFRRMTPDRGSVSPSFRCVHAPGLRHTGLASRRFNNGPERCRGFVSVVVAADPYRAPRRARGTASARIRSGLNRERANGMTSCGVSKAFDPRSRNALSEGRSRPRGMRLIRTLTGCPASKRSGIPKHRSAHQRFNSLSALTPETAHPFTHPRSLIRHPHLHENWM